MGMSVSQDHCEIQVLVFSLVFPFFTTVLIFGVCSVSPTPLCSSSEERKGREMSRASYLLLSELHRNLIILCAPILLVRRSYGHSVNLNFALWNEKLICYIQLKELNAMKITISHYVFWERNKIKSYLLIKACSNHSQISGFFFSPNDLGRLINLGFTWQIHNLWYLLEILKLKFLWTQREQC